MLERISRITYGRDKNGNKLSIDMCPWLKDNLLFKEEFDVLQPNLMISL